MLATQFTLRYEHCLDFVQLIGVYLPTFMVFFVQCNTETEHRIWFTFMPRKIDGIQIECVCWWHNKTNYYNTNNWHCVQQRTISSPTIMHDLKWLICLLGLSATLFAYRLFFSTLFKFFFRSIGQNKATLHTHTPATFQRNSFHTAFDIKPLIFEIRNQINSFFF